MNTKQVYFTFELESGNSIPIDIPTQEEQERKKTENKIIRDENYAEEDIFST